MTPLRVVFLGQNSDITLIPLREVATRHRLVAIVEAATRGFDRDPAESPEASAYIHRSRLSKAGRRFKVPHYFFRSNCQDGLVEFLSELRPDVVCVSSAPILRPEVLNTSAIGFINFHPSILPLYRGPNPWFWQYYFMEPSGGVTINLLDRGEDTGDILLQESYVIELGLPFPKLLERALDVVRRLMPDALDALAEGRAGRVVQRHLPCPFRARHVRRNEPLVDWNVWPLERVWHVLRGTSKWLDPLPPPPSPEAAWLVGAMTHARRTETPGTVSRDEAGYYVSHREGQIRLSIRPSTTTPISVPGT